MRLYPLIFRPRFLEKIWGGKKIAQVLGKNSDVSKNIGESWEIYDFPPGVVDSSPAWISALISNGTFAGRTLHSLIEEDEHAVMGDVPLLSPHRQFPLLIKFLDAREDLSLQVHPDEAYVRAHPQVHLKNEAWYIVQHDPNAVIYKDLVPDVTREAFAQAIGNGTVMEQVQRIGVNEGDCHYLASGTVHALGAGVLVAEVQTPSDTTFRVFDFNRIEPSTGKHRALHVPEAMECIRFDLPPHPRQPRSHVAGLFTIVTRLVSCPNFTIEKVRFSEGADQSIPYDQPVIWIMLQGQAKIRCDGIKEPTHLRWGDTVLLPAGIKNAILTTVTDCVWLEVTFST